MRRSQARDNQAAQRQVPRWAAPVKPRAEPRSEPLVTRLRRRRAAVVACFRASPPAGHPGPPDSRCSRALLFDVVERVGGRNNRGDASRSVAIVSPRARAIERLQKDVEVDRARTSVELVLGELPTHSSARPGRGLERTIFLCVMPTFGGSLARPERKRRAGRVQRRVGQHHSGGVHFSAEFLPLLGSAGLGDYSHYCSHANQRSPTPRPASSRRSQGKGPAYESQSVCCSRSPARS